MAVSSSINLIRGKKPRILDQFVGWALTIGRTVVILTELVALGAFLYRFGLDRELVDLHDKIVQEQSIVNLLKNNENTYLNLQNRLSLAKSVMGSQTQSVKLYQDLLRMLPESVTLKTLIIDQATIKLTLDVPTIEALRTFIERLKGYSGINNVSIDKIENKTTVGLIGVAVTATLKNAPTAKTTKL